MKVFRCYRCDAPAGYEFLGDRAQCPRCGAGHPAVQQLIVTHLLHEAADGPLLGQYELRWKVACQPHVRSLAGLHCSDDPRAVTCFACRKHMKFHEALERLRIDPEEAGGFRIGKASIIIDAGRGCCGD